MLSDENQGHLGQCKKERTKSKKFYPIAVSDERIQIAQIQSRSFGKNNNLF